MNSVITAYNLIEKLSSKTLMGQVSGKISPSPPSGRPGYNLDDSIREREIPTKRGMKRLEKGEKKVTVL